MAILYVTEYARLADDSAGRTIQAGQEPPLAEYTLAIGSSSTSGQALNSQTRVIMLSTDAICHVSIGENPTASTGNSRIPADGIMFRGVPNDKQLKVAVIEGT